MGDEPTEMTEAMRTAMSLDGDVDKLAAFYADWAAYYDEDVATHDYGLPPTMVQTLRLAASVDGSTARYADRTLRVLDAGCGTGLVGVELHAAGYTDLHGVDLSHEMVEVARERGIYRSLEGGVDLTAPPEHLRRSADIVTVGGVFTVGHVPPEALGAMSELVRPGGALVASTRRAYHEEHDFAGAQRALCDAGRLELLVHLADAPYTMDSTGDYWAWRVTAPT